MRLASSWSLDAGGRNTIVTRATSSFGGIPAKKIALLHVAKKQLRLDDDSYRDILRRCAGVDSAPDLDEIGFLRVMKYMTALGFRSTWTKRTFGYRPGMASPAQVELMRKLWAEYHGPHDSESALNAWLSKYHKVSALRFVSAEKARAVIAALRAMIARKQN